MISFKFKRQFGYILNDGEVIPKWYGIAFRDYSSFRTVCYPIPFNILVAFGRQCWICLKNPIHFFRASKDDLREEVDQLRRANAEMKREIYYLKEFGDLPNDCTRR